MSDPDVGVPSAKRSYKELFLKACSFFVAGTVVLLTAVQLYDRFGPVSLPDCDASGVQDTIRNIVGEKTKIGLSAMEAFTPTAKAADSLACTADLTFADKSRGRLSYRVYLKDSEVMVATDGMKPL